MLNGIKEIRKYTSPFYLGSFKQESQTNFLELYQYFNKYISILLTKELRIFND